MSSASDSVVIDFETTIGPNRDPSAFVPSNKVVLAGHLYSNGRPVFEGGPTPSHAQYLMRHGFSLVGHNIAFDLMYILRDLSASEIKESIRDGFQIWDTQLAEYVLSGQQTRMSSLDELSVQYGGTLKDRRVAEMFEAGLGADEIDPALLKEYLEADLKNTQLIYNKQVERAKACGMYPLIQYMNMARLCTAIMQHFGMRVDVGGLTGLRSILEAERESTESLLRCMVLDEIKRAVRADYEVHKSENLVSDSMLSSYLFGGTATIDFVAPTGEVYKSGKKAGQQKTKIVSEKITFSRKVTPFRDTKSSRNYSLIHPLDDDVLTYLEKDLSLFTGKLIRDLRRTDKLIGTYIDGVLKNVYPSGKVHPNFNHALTATGRLSCSNPNLQNQDGEVKQFFLPVGRGGDYLVEFDFKQLEVIGLAYLSQDPQLIEDIRNGVDLHYETGKAVFGWTSPSDMDEQTRRGVKGVNFGLIYGGSAAGLAKQTGFAKETVERLIHSFYTRYPGVRRWQELNIEAVRARRTYSGMEHTDKGFPRGTSWLSSATGRKYVFKEYDAPEWMVSKGTETSFSPTEIKNYPVQGFSTGDLVPITLAVFLQYWARSELTCVPVITVHDSFGASCYGEDTVKELATLVKESVIPAVKSVLKDTWGIELNMPLVVEPKYGKNWGDMKKLK